MEQQNNNKKETYSAVVMANALQMTQNGKESVAIQVQTIANLVTGEEAEKRFVGNLWLTPAAVEKSIETLREVFGYKENSFRPLNDPKKLNGVEVEITVEYDIYNGQERASVRWFNKPGSFANRGIKPIADSLAASICERLDAYFINAGQAAAPNAMDQGNDLPF